MWMTSCTGSVRGGFLGFWRKSVSWVLGPEEDSWLLGQARGLVAGAPRVCVGVGRWKSQHRKMISLSLCRKTFKLKGNKKFRTWTKKSWVFFVFRDSYVLCIYVMNILCTFHISVYLCYICLLYIFTNTQIGKYGIMLDYVIWFNVSTLEGYLMPNLFYTYDL